MVGLDVIGTGLVVMGTGWNSYKNKCIECEPELMSHFKNKVHIGTIKKHIKNFVIVILIHV